MYVKQLMTKNPETVEVTATIRQAVRKLFELEIRHLPVMDNGELVGMISDRDLRSYFPVVEEVSGQTNAVQRLLDRPVSSMMQGDPLTVDDESDITEAIDLFLEHKVGALPVVDTATGKLRGILSYIDILRSVRDDLTVSS